MRTCRDERTKCIRMARIRRAYDADMRICIRCRHANLQPLLCSAQRASPIAAGGRAGYQTGNTHTHGIRRADKTKTCMHTMHVSAKVWSPVGLYTLSNDRTMSSVADLIGGGLHTRPVSNQLPVPLGSPSGISSPGAAPARADESASSRTVAHWLALSVGLIEDASP